MEVFGSGLAAFRPRHDVVAFHLLVLKVSTADWAHASLSLVCRALFVVVELPQVQLLAPRLAGKEKFIDFIYWVAD